MGRGPVQIRGYDQRSNALTAQRGYVRPVDQGPGLGAGLASLAGGLQDVVEGEREVERLRLAREEDDGRTYALANMATARARANEIRRTALQEAPDGWRGVTQRVAGEWGQLRDSLISQAPTDSARRFMSEQFDQYQPLLLEEVAESEQTARQGWRSDTIRSATDTASSVLAADPNQYDRVREENLAVIRTLSDMTPDQRRDMEAYAEEQFAVSAMSGLVERDPRAALGMLRDPEAVGAVSRLSGSQRITLENRAQAEINRRNAEAREARNQYVASLRDTVAAQNQLLSRGITPSQPLNVSELSSLLGPDVAQNYLANLAGASAQQEMAGMPMTAVAQVAAGAVTGEGSDIERLLTVEARNAASRVLQQRNEDPGGYALQNGLMRGNDLMSTLAGVYSAPGGVANWPALESVLSARGSDAVALRQRGVTNVVRPLSNDEARGLSQWLGQLPVQARLDFFTMASSAMNREAYTAMMGQIAPEGAGPVTAFAGYLNSNPSPNSHGPTVARRLLRGEEILHGGAPNQEGRRQPLVAMPSEEEMRREWRGVVGQAYAGRPQAEEGAYQAYRAYYAALAEEDGVSDNAIDSTRASRAAAAASGGVIRWNGRETIMPWGMSEREFNASARAGFQRWTFLRDADPQDYQLRSLGGGRYEVLEGESTLRNPITGRPVEIEIRR
jgi:hypothetical protein